MINKGKKLFVSLLGVGMLYSCTHNKPEAWWLNGMIVAEKQIGMQVDNVALESYPRTLNEDGTLKTTALNDWTDGFFPGSLWYLYEYTQDEHWKEAALKWMLPMEKLQYLKSHHDIGFLMYCSYGNAYRLAPDESYKEILIQSAASLCSRFTEEIGCIKSWDYRESWDKQHKWYYPVIIDNMMNLELLYAATQFSGDSVYARVANKHANTTAKNHFRDDYSSCHVVNYVPTTGEVEFKGTCQGFADNSTWARGQAWAIYGYTMCYRYTKNAAYLELAENLSAYWLNNPRMPEDGVPYWDFNAGEPGWEPAGWVEGRMWDNENIHRDASAAAITASAFLELYELTGKKLYFDAARKMLMSLSSPDYLAEVGTNGGFVLKHSVGSLPHETEIDVPLVYADYYYLEAMLRYRAICNEKAI